MIYLRPFAFSLMSSDYYIPSHGRHPIVDANADIIIAVSWMRCKLISKHS